MKFPLEDALYRHPHEYGIGRKTRFFNRMAKCFRYTFYNNPVLFFINSQLQSYAIMSNANIELLREVYATIEGIPAEAISLGQWRTQEGESLEKGTVCCPGTWLTQHPHFRELGLTEDGRGRPAYGPYRGYAALGAIFRIDTEVAYALFCPQQSPTSRNVSDKDLFLQRLRAYINKHQPKRPAVPKV